MTTATLSVAETILHQLGGRRFIAMTGAKNFVTSPDSLFFALPANFAKHGINKVRITLNCRDLYDIEFAKMRGLKYTVIATLSDVYAENLRDVFTDATGLDTHL